ncbi:hypothetical protein KEU06_23500 [Pseudaminobacter sp. 19-2017]|uniref:Uncharacterized protein n=1 Tax=Pseudaminobacter soli (ex Zhang et al. 2022) TaxID=2831468 RepID=A0A942I499_9HYPH|nr:hypothetical protein [Pseudaminobacter soli]MBS3651588.1 hypothetical protein [Pseudaminobacter soli]
MDISPIRSKLRDKVRALSRPELYGPAVREVEARETQMSWVFLTGSRVYKLKKPNKRPFLDFGTIERRRFFCEEELRLNRRLAAETYLRVRPLRRLPDGDYSIGASGRIVDWLVEMKQLPHESMMDELIDAGRLSQGPVLAVSDRLASFYAQIPGEISQGRLYMSHLLDEQRINRALLQRAELGLALESADLLARTDARLEESLPEMETRIAAGLIVEGHGDLRPEHVWLGEPLQIIDCLEFSRRMRILDPYDEANYLGMECEVIGAGWVRQHLLDALKSRFGHEPSERLLSSYGAFRALLRARLSIAHLLERRVRRPEKWRPLALRYLQRAERELARSRPSATRKSSRPRAAV